jgi:hypothetical protein
MALTLSTLCALAATAGAPTALAAAPLAPGLAQALPAEASLAASEGTRLAQTSRTRRRRARRQQREAQEQEQQEQEQQEEKPAAEGDTGLGLDLSEPAAPAAPAPAESEPAEPVAAEAEQAPAPAHPVRLRLGVGLAPGAMLGLPNTLAGGTLRLRGALDLLPWLDLGLGVGGGEWSRLGGQLGNSPGYAWLGTLEAELAARVKLGGPFVDLFGGLRAFNVEEARRGYLMETRPLMLGLGAGYTVEGGMPLDVGVRFSVHPGPLTAYSAEAQVVLWLL